MKAKILWSMTLLIFSLLPAAAVAGVPLMLNLQESPDGSLLIAEPPPQVSTPAPAVAPMVRLTGSQLREQLRWDTAVSGRGQVIVTRGPGKQQPLQTAPGREDTTASPPPGEGQDLSWNPLIDQVAQAYGVDAKLIRLVMRQESGFNPTAVSPKGALGLMQLMPGTATLLGVQDPFNPVQNIEAGVRYLKQCLERFQNNLPLALAAYNAGPENVAKYQGVPPFAETQEYVARIMQEYTGQPVILPAALDLPASPDRQASRPIGKKPAFSQPDLQPLLLPSGQLVRVLQTGKMKILEILPH
ncbi:MAG: lytic transglycosylase domain-containing protein [Desulfobacca sp.]|uniref:lytic transglycosylase domain-containing protein n=1 Tax=Desulfobacca sp. TaxID=2067990 RepID=UPI004049443E